MVGAQNAMKMASNLSPVRNITSETIIIEITTSSIMQFITPIRSIKFLIIISVLLTKYNDL
jgi:hypothetical protein